MNKKRDSQYTIMNNQIVTLSAILSTSSFQCQFCAKQIKPKSRKQEKQQVAVATLCGFVICPECWKSSQQEKQVQLHPYAHLGECENNSWRKMYGYDKYK